MKFKNAAEVVIEKWGQVDTRHGAEVSRQSGEVKDVYITLQHVSLIFLSTTPIQVMESSLNLCPLPHTRLLLP